MDGFTDPPMRALQGELGAFSFAVSEFIRVSTNAVPQKVYHREVPELLTAGRTVTGLPVQVQILGGNPKLMAESAHNAWLAGAQAIDINFGCPAPTVNRNDGGATILKYPSRVREIVAAVRQAVPKEVPVSAKIRLGYDKPEDVHHIAAMAVEGGANWLVIHARTKTQKYAPPVYWKLLHEVREASPVPVVANGDIWNIDDFRRCREETGCLHFMLGRGALVNPMLASQAAEELGISVQQPSVQLEWVDLLRGLSGYSQNQTERLRKRTLHRLKQWLNLARRFGTFPDFDLVKRTQTKDEFFANLPKTYGQSPSSQLALSAATPRTYRAASSAPAP